MMNLKIQTAIVSMYRLLIFAALAGGIILLAEVDRVFQSPQRSPGTVPSLEIPTQIAVDSQGLAAVPVQFAASGTSVAAALFSIDYDEQCLLFDPIDADLNGTPDNLLFNVPSQFTVSTFFDTLNTSGELQVVIVDYSPPYSVFPDQTLLTIRLAARCTPAQGETITARVGFGNAPLPSLSSPSGSSVKATFVDGSVSIGDNLSLPTLAPTATSTPNPAATQTPVPTATAPNGTIPPTPDSSDADVDGLLSREEGASDWDGDGISNDFDADDDNDGIPTLLEGRGDVDGGGVPNFLDLDSNGNGISDRTEAGENPLRPVDRDGNGIFDFLDVPMRLYLPHIAR